MLRITIISIILLLLCNTAFTQVNQNAGIDEKGEKFEINLKEGEIIKDSILETKPIFIEETDEIYLEKTAMDQTFTDVQIKLFTNSIQGAVFIKLNSFPLKDNPDIEVWDPFGNLIGKSRITSQITRINLWGKVGGNYLIKTKLNGVPVTWEVRKM